jgi:hypothetical protein
VNSVALVSIRTLRRKPGPDIKKADLALEVPLSARVRLSGELQR